MQYCGPRFGAVGAALVLSWLIPGLAHAQETAAGQPSSPPAGPTPTVTIRETFAGPPAGAALHDRWKCGFGWEWRDDALHHALAGKQFAAVEDAPYGESVTIEATVTLAEATGSEWKIAGIVLMWDKRNYWHLALVESPTDQGGKHFIELSEMFEGTWLSQSKLTALSMPTLPEFDWKYGRPYRLTLTLGGGRITGTVSEMDGTTRWHAGFEFSAPGVAKGRPALDNGGFRAAFRDFAATVSRHVPPPEQAKRELPAYSVKGSGTISGEQTGYFHTQKIGGKWWIIDPAGNAFFAVATDHVNYRAHWCQALGYSVHHRNVQAKYGSEQAWAESATARLVKWGFNTLGAGCHEPTRYQGLAHTIFTSMGGHFCALGAEYRICYPENEKPTPCSVFPNVFHPRFAEYCELRAEETCAPHANDPWLLGYFLDNELKWWGRTRATPFGLFEDCMDKPSTHSAKIALVDWLTDKFGTITRFNRAWGANVASFAAILDMQELTGTNEKRVRADKLEFVAVIVDRYFRITTEAIRKHDPNHMTLGCRFAGLNTPAYIPAWKAAGKYCNIVTTNVYEKVDLETGETYCFFEGERTPLHERFRAVNKLTGGTPLWVTEWSYPAYDSGLPCKHGAGQRVDTQAERTFAFEAFQKLLFGLPYMVGSSFFMWVDEPALGISEWFPEDSNYGLVNEKDEPYKLLTDACTRLNPRAYDVHDGRTAEIEVKRRWRAGQFTVRNTGKAPAVCTVTVWTDGKPEQSEIRLEPGRSAKVSGDPTTLAAKGGHYVVCAATVAGGAVEVETGDNRAETHLYQHGVDVTDAAPDGPVVPIVLTNAAGVVSRPFPIVLNVPDLGPVARVDWEREAARLQVLDVSSGSAVPVPAQLDSLEAGDELAIEVPSIAPMGVCTLVVCLSQQARQQTAAPPVSYRETDQGFTIANGRLRLVKDTPSGNLLDRVELDGVELGRYYPMIHQEMPQSMWTAPGRLENVEILNGPVRLVLTATMQRAGATGETKTTVDEEGEFEQAEKTPGSFRTTCRVCVYPNRSWFAVRGLSVENIDTRPWRVASYFHYTPSNIAGDAANDEAKPQRWYDPEARLAYGAVDPAQLFTVSFWLDKAGGQHPDARRAVGVDLKPGHIHTEPEATLYIGGTTGEDRRAWTEFKDAINTAGSVSYRIHSERRYHR